MTDERRREERRAFIRERECNICFSNLDKRIKGLDVKLWAIIILVLAHFIEKF